MLLRTHTPRVGCCVAMALVCAMGGAPGCAHHTSNLDWALANNAPVHNGEQWIRGKALGELEVSVELYGVVPWTYPLGVEQVAGSPFGPRTGPTTGTPGFHYGQDIPCRRGTPVFSAAAGEVVTSRRSNSAGKYIEIQHPSAEHEVTTQYMHLARRGVRVGRDVRKGKRIGRCGNTGNSTNPHLHFGVVVDGEKVPPLVYVNREVRRQAKAHAPR